MSWLRDHAHFWVYPVLHQLAFGEKQNLTVHDVKDISPLSSTEVSRVKDLIAFEAKKSSRTFSRKVLGYTGWAQYPTVIRSVIKSVESHMEKLGHRRLLLTGRDTWVFAVLAERRRIPYTSICLRVCSVVSAQPLR